MFNSPTHLGLILTAAGASSRMGIPKGLIEIDQCPLYLHHLKNFDAAFPLGKSILVLGNHLDQYRQAFLNNTNEKVQIVINEQHELGQFSSIQTGVIEALKSGLEFVFLQPIDLPPLTPSLYQELFEQRYGRWVVKPRFDRKSGHPLLLNRQTLELIEAADPQVDRLDHLLRALPQDRINWYDCQEEGIIQNLNTPLALELYLSNRRKI